MNSLKLKDAGISTAVGIKRFRGNRDIYEGLLLKFPEDQSFRQLTHALVAGDVEDAFASAHALKGTAGNLALVDLHASLTPLVELLRGGTLNGASDLFEPVAKSYHRAVSAINELKDESESLESLESSTEASSVRLDQPPFDLDFQALCSICHAPMTVVDPATRKVLYMNDAGIGILGRGNEIPAKDAYCWKLNLHKDAPCEDCPIAEILESDEIIDRSVFIPEINATINAEYRRFISNGTPLLAISIHDNKDSNSAVENTRKEVLGASARSTMLSRVTHDMRTPMNTILGLTHLIADKEDLNEVKDDVRQIASAGRYLLDLINDTLDAEKLNSGLQRLHVKVADEEDILMNAYGIVSKSIAEKGVEFSLENKAEWKSVLVDAQRLEQVFVNILSNALKFTPRNGKITIEHNRTQDNGSFIVDQFVFSDTGVGMSEEFTDRMFAPFEQEDESAKTEIKGTGLGLFLVKESLELMGGTIDVESEKGKGSTFTITLEMPIAIVDGTTASNTKYLSAEDFDLTGCKVLLFEDHEVNATITAAILEKVGCDVIRAENGQIGFEIFEKSEPKDFDVILMDIRMPLMDGIETTRAIRALDRPDAKSVPIVALSANAFASDIEESAKAGMNAHLSKPIEPALLFRTLIEVLPRYRKKIQALPKIIFVDDDPTNVALLDVSLRDYYNLLFAKSGEEALKVLEDNPDTIALITDLQMPGMGGFKLIEKVRSERKYDRIAVIANTQYGGPEQEEELLHIGADDFIYKPTTSHIVQIRLLNALRRRV